VQVEHLWLTDYRSYESLDLALPSGLTAVLGPNGQGKTNLLEAIGWLATMSSFRGAATDALVRRGAERAIVRADMSDAGRTTRIEAELAVSGRNRVLVNGARPQRARDLLGHLRVTVFTPDDLMLVKGGPAERRRVLDDALVALHVRHDRTRTDFERVLRHRNALLKQVGGRLDTDAAATLEVWDLKLADAGDRLGAARAELVAALEPLLQDAYVTLAPATGDIRAHYHAPWRATGLATALAEARREELRRGQTLVGPHRDDLVLDIDGLPARTHRSQGEQRSLALALRLAVHRHVEHITGSTPVLLLDDVFSELDPARSAALLGSLPAVQTLLTSASGLPADTHPELVLHLQDGTIRADRVARGRVQDGRVQDSL
jgi:DNA replication and repair protein RecF